MTASCVEVLGRAKVNLFLAVGPRRPDGYHEVSSVMQTVDLADTLVLRPAETSSVTFRPGPGFEGELPEPPDLVAKALALYREVVAEVSLAVEVTKLIPIAAGLAGGSADAAAALLGADEFRGGESPRERLEALCRRLGSDVPFSFRGGTALVGGTGEKVSPLPSPHRVWWVLGISAFPLSSAEVYQRFDELGPPDAGPDAGPDADAGTARPGKLIKALVAGHPKEIAACLRNDLEAAAFDLAPQLGNRKKAMKGSGALAAVLSGSGPTIAGLCRNEPHAEEVAARVRQFFDRVEVVTSAPAGAEVVAVER